MNHLVQTVILEKGFDCRLTEGKCHPSILLSFPSLAVPAAAASTVVIQQKEVQATVKTL